MSKIEVNTVAPQCGTTLTLGESGDTVTLGSGASQSGFGRTGTVDWQTGDIKTSDFTPVNGQGFFVDTNSGVVEATLPAGSAGAIVSFQDYRNTFDTSNLKVTPNGSEKINGGAGSIVLSTEGEGLTLVYIDSTIGWRSIQDNDFATAGSNFIVATGGTETTSGDCKIHTFTGPGTFTVSAIAACAAQNVASHLIVAGGGGGAAGGNNEGGGGGGAGGYREVKNPATPYTASPLDGYPSSPNRVTLTAQAYPIVVGAGGAGNTCGGGGVPAEKGNPGSNSSFGGQTATAGGGGGAAGPPGCNPGAEGLPGGSAGGSGAYATGTPSGNTPPTTPAQGNNGGTGQPAPASAPGYGAGGGGGAGGTGTPANTGSTSPTGGPGGDGVGTQINPAVGVPGPSGPLKYFAGGGGGGKHPAGTGDSSGGDGGGAPGSVIGGPSRNATANTGGGGGGVGETNSSGSGGSGIVVIRYKFQ
jgi:hypothetical protein